MNSADGIGGGLGSGFGFAQDADVGEVAVEFVGVHATADEVLRRGAESEPVGLRLLLFGTCVLFQCLLLDDPDTVAFSVLADEQTFFLKGAGYFLHGSL